MQDTSAADQSKPVTNESGFTLLETVISMVLLAIIGLGIASLFAYAASTTSNAGDREMATAVAQQRMEQLRSVPFTDSSLAATQTSGTTTSVTRLGRQYDVVTTISDTSVVDSNVTLKTITVKVVPTAASASWSTNVSSIFGSVTLISERSGLTMGPNRSY